MATSYSNNMSKTSVASTEQMHTPILELMQTKSNEPAKFVKPRDLKHQLYIGQMKCLQAHAGNPLELSAYVYGDLNGVDALMQINERRSPFDFEEDDVLVVADEQTFASVTQLSNPEASTTQPQRLGKTTTGKQKQVANASSASIAANVDKKPHAIADAKTGTIRF